MKLSNRLGHVKPSMTLAITSRAAAMRAEGIDIVSFGAGEPDFNTPEPVVEAAKNALDHGVTRYTPVTGIPALRAAIAQWYTREFGIETSTDHVIIGVGGKQVIYNALMALIDVGDRVLIPSPYWVSYPAMVYLASGEPVFVKTSEKTSFLMTPEQLEAALHEYQPKALIMNSPSNPTGQVYEEEHLKALAEVLRKYPDVMVIWDNIYAHITYGDCKHIDLARVAPDLAERIITTCGFSKSFAMTGWRLGFAIADPKIIKAMSSIQGHSTSNATSFAQAGAIEALKLDHSYLEENRMRFEKRKNILLDELSKIENVSCLEPKGAFYALVNVKKYCHSLIDARVITNDLELAEYLLVDGHVACIPGCAFGADGYLRLSFAMKDEDIVEGIRRIGRALSKLTPVAETVPQLYWD